MVEKNVNKRKKMSILMHGIKGKIYEFQSFCVLNVDKLNLFVLPLNSHNLTTFARLQKLSETAPET